MSRSFYKKLTARQHTLIIKAPDGCLGTVKAEVNEVLGQLYYRGKTNSWVTELKGGIQVDGLDWRTVFELPLRLHTPSELALVLQQKVLKYEKQLEEFCDASRLAEHFTSGAELALKTNCTASRIYHEGMVRERLKRYLEKNCDVSFSENGYPLRLDIVENRATLSIGLCRGGFWRQRLKVSHSSLAPLREDFAASFLFHALQQGKRVFGQDSVPRVIAPFGGSGTFLFLTALQLWRQNHFWLHPEDFFTCLRHVEESTLGFVRSKLVEDRGDLRRVPFTYNDVSEKEVTAFQQNLVAFSHKCPLAVQVVAGDLFQAEALRPEGLQQPVFLPMNPPWGERLSDRKVARSLYRRLPRFLDGFANCFGFVLITQKDVLRDVEKDLISRGIMVEVASHNYFGINLKCLFFFKKT